VSLVLLFNTLTDSTLILRRTLNEIHLDTVDIVHGEGSWASLECTAKEELLVETFTHRDHE
jgi:hypothetical protein